MKEHIDEMTKVLVDYTEKNHIMASHVILEDYAEQLYNAGYRKQEWISVDERLPDNSDQILIYLDNGNIEVGYYDTDNNKFYHFLPMPRAVYWMPLPQPPKMKGGAE